MKIHSFALPLVAILFICQVAGAQNLLRNGSFEGGLLYWHNIVPAEHTLVKEGKAGVYALRLADEWIASAPVALEMGKNYTISMWARTEKGEANLGVSLAPSARETAVNAGRLWRAGAGKGAKIDENWKRVSFTFPADVKTDGFWPNPHYMLHIGGGKQSAILVDGITITPGDQMTADYQPRTPVEVTVNCANLPGWTEKGNIFEQDAEAQVIANVSNPSGTEQKVTIVWQLYDFESINPLNKAVEEKVTLKPGETVTPTKSIKLTPRGTVLARVSVIGDAGGNGGGNDRKVIDKSEMPLTTLPYPMNRTKADMNERFGGSFAGGVGVLDKMQAVGFGWTRWWPHQKWHDFEPEQGKFDWQNDKFQLAFDRGIACHVTLYGWPTWIMDKDNPLPRDMRWKADDPKWQDLSISTAWDKFIIAAAENFRGKPVVFEIANEPGFDNWDNHLDEYVKFNERTAALLKKTDPKSHVMVDNVYINPSRPNARLLEKGDLSNIDSWSWHDYHAGWLTDATGIQRIRKMLDNAGTNPGKGKHIEIWFNEGWAFTNTAVDETIAATGLTSAESTNAIIDSVIEMTAAGQKKTVLFHLSYESHGQSFWDYSGPGVQIWDWYNYPMPLVPAWNVLNHHISLSEPAGIVRPRGATINVFQDLRNKRGVMLAYADRNAKEDVTVKLPDLGVKNLTAEDIMGNPVKLENNTVVLSKTGRAVVIFPAPNEVTSSVASPAPADQGAKFFAALDPLDRRHSGFVETDASGATVWALPSAWAGKTDGKSDGSVVESDGKAVWKAEQVWPPDPMQAGNYRPLIWGGTQWIASADGFGGQPQLTLKDEVLDFGTRAPHGTPPQLRTAALTFVVPADGTYQITGSAVTKMWDSNNATTLHILRRSGDKVTVAKDIQLEKDKLFRFENVTLDAKAGDMISFVPQISGMFAGGTTLLRDFRIVKLKGE